MFLQALIIYYLDEVTVNIAIGNKNIINFKYAASNVVLKLKIISLLTF